METDLKTRLQIYAAAAELPIPADPSLYADALASSAAAAAAESAGIICGHTRILRAELEFLNDQPSQEGDDQVVTAPSDPAAPAKRFLTFPAGANTMEKIALGSLGIPLIKNG